MSYLATMIERYPVRKKEEQKTEFLNWAQAEAEKLGYSAKIDTLGKKGEHRNLVIGNPAEAETIFTAHYDTPAGSIWPNLMTPRNIPFFIVYQILIVALLLIPAFAAMWLGNVIAPKTALPLLMYMVVYFGLLMLLTRGPANKHNVNDNTSGVAAVMELMVSIPEEARGKAAFILFDNEEKGKLGSKAYAKANLEISTLKLVVNMDCVGVGDHFLVIAKKAAMYTPAYEKFYGALKAKDGKQAHYYPSMGSVCNSDQASFQCGVAVVACKKVPVIGYCTGRIHTKRDTVADEANIRYLADNLAEYVQAL